MAHNTLHIYSSGDDKYVYNVLYESGNVTIDYALNNFFKTYSMNVLEGGNPLTKKDICFVRDEFNKDSRTRTIKDYNVLTSKLSTSTNYQNNEIELKAITLFLNPTIEICILPTYTKNILCFKR
jgi:hypothetical protein